MPSYLHYLMGPCTEREGTPFGQKGVRHPKPLQALTTSWKQHNKSIPDISTAARNNDISLDAALVSVCVSSTLINFLAHLISLHR